MVLFLLSEKCFGHNSQRAKAAYTQAHEPAHNYITANRVFPKVDHSARIVLGQLLN